MLVAKAGARGGPMREFAVACFASPAVGGGKKTLTVEMTIQLLGRPKAQLCSTSRRASAGRT